MLLKYYYDERLAQASYLIGCLDTGEAVVIDPARDITPYLHTAQTNGLIITAVTETHIHADFVSGVRELANMFSAHLYLSAMGDYDYPDKHITRLKDGDSFMIGAIRLEVLHTPGHTPEHISFLFTDTKAADKPMGILTGDCLFAGDIGRPDLLEAVGQNVSAVAGARQQFASVQRLKTLPDYLQVFPGHSAGSVCGKALGAVPSTTLGYEKLFNPAFQFNDENAFVQWLLADQPDVPRYFARMKHVNRVGPELLRDLPQAQHIKESPVGIIPDDALFVDTRSAAEFARKHLPGTINVPINEREFCTYLGEYVDYGKRTFFIAYQTDIPDVLQALLAIGVDDVPAYFTPEVLGDAATGTITSLSPEQVAAQNLHILDVRHVREYRERHIPGAQSLPMGAIPARLNEIPHDQPVAVQCASGSRSQIVVSLLQRAGFTNVVNLDGGIEAWRAAGLPVEEAE